MPSSAASPRCIPNSTKRSILPLLPISVFPPAPRPSLATVRALLPLFLLAFLLLALPAVFLSNRTLHSFSTPLLHSSPRAQANLTDKPAPKPPPDALSHPPPAPSAPSSTPLPRSATRLMLVTDFWERMANMHHAICALVLYGLERDFSIVEPFVYESKALNEFSTPEHFRQLGMKPQPASLYYDMRPLFDTGRLVRYATMRHRVKLHGQPHAVVNAAIWVPWNEPPEVYRGRMFYWCDDKFDGLAWKWNSSQYGRAIVPGFHVQRLLCLNPLHTMHADAPANATYFDDLFAFVAAGTKDLPRTCEECVSVMVVNYRKHLFDGVEPSDQRDQLIAKSFPSMLVGQEPQDLARRVVREALHGRKYIGIQMRTGKAYALLERYEKEIGNGMERLARFKKWLKACCGSLVKSAKMLARESESEDDVVYYLASDMVNSGWKGGEWAPPEVFPLFNESVTYFKRELGLLYWFEPKTFGIEQDVMGVSGAVDAAMMYFADNFTYSMPSSFGFWVDSQRSHHHKSKAVVVDCNIPEFHAVDEGFPKQSTTS